MSQQTLEEAVRSIQYDRSTLEGRDGSREAILKNAHDGNHRPVHLVHS